MNGLNLVLAPEDVQRMAAAARGHQARPAYLAPVVDIRTREVIA